MTEQMTKAPEENLEGRRSEAMALHQYIQAQGRVMAGAMSEIGRSLKRMRDEKLYLALGHENFEGYTTAMLDLKQRQAYNYIKVYETYGPRFLDEHGELGISKLLLLANVPAPEREDFLAENRVEELSTRQLEEITEKFNKQAEQLSLLQSEKTETAKTAEELTRTLELERARYRENESKYAAQLKALESRPVDVAVQEPNAATLERIRSEERERAEALLVKEREQAAAQLLQERESARTEAFEQFKEQKQKAEEKARQETQRERKRAEDAEARANAAEQEREALAQNDAQLAAARERARELEQRLQVAENPLSLRIQFCFEQVQGQIDQITDLLNQAPEEDEDKFRAAARAMLERLAAEV